MVSKRHSRPVIEREGTMAARVELREISNEEGNRLLRMIRRRRGSMVTWRRAQIVLLAAQRMPAPRIAEVVFSDPDTVREVIHNFNRDGFDALYPRYRGGRPRTFTLPQRQADQADRAGDPDRPWPAVCELEPGQARRLPGRRGGGRRHLPQGTPPAAARGRRQLSSRKKLEALQRSRPSRRRRTGSSSCTRSPTASAKPGACRPGRRRQPGRVRAAQPAAAARREGVGAADEAAPDPRHLHPPARRPASALRRSTSATTCSAASAPSERRGSSSSPSATRSAPATRQRPGSRSISTTSPPTRERRSAAGPKANNVELAYTPRLRLLAEPDRAAVQRAPLLLPRRHRPPRPRDASQPDRRPTSTGATTTATTPSSATSPDANSSAKQHEQPGTNVAGYSTRRAPRRPRRPRGSPA